MRNPYAQSRARSVRPIVLGIVLALLIAALPATHAQAASRVSPKSERAVAADINAARRAAGLPALKSSPVLTRSSRAYARRMIKRQIWAHSSNLRVSGFHAIGEILGMSRGASGGALGVVDAWLASPTHHAVIMNPRYRCIGVAGIKGSFQGAPSTVWVVRFGR
jgi:uncharacterized protein YkwD